MPQWAEARRSWASAFLWRAEEDPGVQGDAGRMQDSPKWMPGYPCPAQKSLPAAPQASPQTVNVKSSSQAEGLTSPNSICKVNHARTQA